MNFPPTFIRPVTAILFALSLVLPVLAQNQQTPIDIEWMKTIPDPAPPVITFHNYNQTYHVKVENTFGAQEKFFAAGSNDLPSGPELVETIANEWATIRATPCTSSADTVCAKVATNNLYPGGPYVTVNGKDYYLQQFHFHVPAEHAINGIRAAMEIHFVHLQDNVCTSATDGRPGLVLAVLVAEGWPGGPVDNFFSGLNLESLPQDATVNLSSLLPTNYTWRYDGGLTAPAGKGLCGFVLDKTQIPTGGTVAQQLVSGVFPEVVHWFLYGKPLFLSNQQLKNFKQLFPEGNARNLKENENPVYVTW